MASKKNIKIDLSIAAQKLSESGIEIGHAVELGMSCHKALELSKTFADVKALKIPYFDIDSSPTDFYRIRYLESPPGFAIQMARPQRYAQLPDSVNWVYFPKLNSINWQVIAGDSTIPLLITEGELKAASACIQGYLTIGLGGVSVWQSSKKMIPLLPPMDRVNWKGRQVTIIFDSDAATNPQVAAAEVRLAEALTKQGAVVSIASLPSDGTKKQGLDDFLVAEGNLERVIRDAKTTYLCSELTSLNEQYAFVIDQDVIINFETAQRHKRDSFVNGLLANHRLIEFRPNLKTGTNVRVEVSVASEWLKWPTRRAVRALTYEPGKPKVTEASDYNLWRSWGAEPRAGTVKPWEELLAFLFDLEGCENCETCEQNKELCAERKANRLWFERWCAYPLQYPGTKLYSAAVIWGPETGTGKSLVGYTLGRIYGNNFAEIGNADLHAGFNEWTVGKQFIMGDEISGSDKRSEGDKLKQLITQLNLRINCKFLPSYEVRDCLNYYFTSNNPDAFFLSDQDRRFFIHRVPYERKPQAFYKSYMLWLNNGGAEFLFDYLLKLDLGEFDPAAAAPSTESKREMTDSAKSDVATFVSNLKHNIDDELLRFKELFYLKAVPELALNKHLRLLYDPAEHSRVTANGLGRELSRAGFKTLAPVDTKIFGKQRFCILRNPQKWLNAMPDTVREHIDTIYEPMAKKGNAK